MQAGCAQVSSTEPLDKAMNYRGCGGLEMTSPRFGCADSWRDFDEVMEHLESNNKGSGRHTEWSSDRG
eukprot:5410966-Amphidinium_carterae.1